MTLCRRVAEFIHILRGDAKKEWKTIASLTVLFVLFGALLGAFTGKVGVMAVLAVAAVPGAMCVSVLYVAFKKMKP